MAYISPLHIKGSKGPPYDALAEKHNKARHQLYLIPVLHSSYLSGIRLSGSIIGFRGSQRMPSRRSWQSEHQATDCGENEWIPYFQMIGVISCAPAELPYGCV